MKTSIITIHKTEAICCAGVFYMFPAGSVFDIEILYARCGHSKHRQSFI